MELIFQENKMRERSIEVQIYCFHNQIQWKQSIVRKGAGAT